MIPADEFDAIVWLLAEHCHEELVAWQQDRDEHRARWKDLRPCTQPFFARQAAAWTAIADGWSAVPLDDERLSFSRRRERVAFARFMASSFALKASLFGIDFENGSDADFDLLRRALDEAQAVVDRHGWAVGLGTTGEAAA